MRQGIESKLSSSKAWTQIDQELPGIHETRCTQDILDVVLERGRVCTAATYNVTVSNITHALKDLALFSDISSQATTPLPSRSDVPLTQ